MVRKSVFLDLKFDQENYAFSTSIADALTQAEAELFSLNETIQSIKELKPACDRMDYALAASSGALCGIIDVFLVGKPSESSLNSTTDKWFADRTMDFAKLCHPEGKTFESLESAVRFLEKEFKVPYDQTGLGDAGRVVFGLNAKNHHFKSLAHNPSLLGLFFSILDQFSNTSHFVTNGQLISLQDADGKWELKGINVPSKLFCGFVNWFGHLVSDVSGSQSSAKVGSRGMGIPSPFWTWTNDIIAIKAKLGLSATDLDKTMNELALSIFKKGYDTRFQTTQAIPVLINELLVRFIYAIRRLLRYCSMTPREERTFTHMWESCEPFSNVTVKRMLTVAHGTFCLVDIGDATGRAFVQGAGAFDVCEFILRLNIIGVGRFAISLYGETTRVFSYNRVQREADYAAKEKVVVVDYINGLNELAQKYDDAHLLQFVDDFKSCDAYSNAFEKTVSLAELRNVSADKILRNKADIDRYFRGK